MSLFELNRAKHYFESLSEFRVLREYWKRFQLRAAFRPMGLRAEHLGIQQKKAAYLAT